jgi:hypothetical protein
MKALVRLLWTLLLLFGLGACGLFTPYRLVCDEYGFSVEFPEKPIEQSSNNYQGLPKACGLSRATPAKSSLAPRPQATETR